MWQTLHQTYKHTNRNILLIMWSYYLKLFEVSHDDLYKIDDYNNLYKPFM